MKQFEAATTSKLNKEYSPVMYTIQTLNAISPVIYNHLPQDSYTVAKETAAPDAIIVRSRLHARHGASGFPAVHCARRRRLQQHPCWTNAPKRASCVFNTPGANANAVKELVLCRSSAGLARHHRRRRMGQGASSARRDRRRQAGRKGQESVCRPGSSRARRWP